MNRRRRHPEQEYKLKFDAVEQTRKTFVDDQAKLDKALAKIREETADLEEAKCKKRSDALVILNSFITKKVAELGKHTKKSKELEGKTSEFDASEKQLDILHTDTISKLENQNFKLKNEQL